MSRTRLVNQSGPQPILFSEITAYCDLIGIFGEEERRDLIFFLETLDVLWLQRIHARITKNREDQERQRQREAERNRNKYRRR